MGVPKQGIQTLEQIATVDPILMKEAMSLTTGEMIIRIQKATETFLARRLDPKIITSVTHRMQALHELLRAHPDLRAGDISTEGIIYATAMCPLNVPPANPLLGDDMILFDLPTFRTFARVK